MQTTNMPAEKLKTSSLIIGLSVVLVFAVAMGLTTGPSFGSQLSDLLFICVAQLTGAFIERKNINDLQ